MEGEGEAKVRGVKEGEVAAKVEETGKTVDGGGLGLPLLLHCQPPGLPDVLQQALGRQAERSLLALLKAVASLAFSIRWAEGTSFLSWTFALFWICLTDCLPAGPPILATAQGTCPLRMLVICLLLVWLHRHAAHVTPAAHAA
jgi:hypothetical protein